MAAAEAMAPSAAALLDDDDDFEYGEVEVPDFEEELADDASEDLDTALQRVLQISGQAGTKPQEPQATVEKHPEVVDDFVRNFLIKMGLTGTLETFETEWYELKASGKLPAAALERVPDAYMHNANLSDDVLSLQSELRNARAVAAKASATWDGFRKERDFHRMHHKRVVQEKNKLIKDIKNLKAHYEKYEPTIVALRKKYQSVMKEKMLLSMDRDKLKARLATALDPHGDSAASTQLIKADNGSTALPESTLGTTASKAHDTVKSASPGAAKRAPETIGGRGTTASEKPSGASLPAAPRHNPFADLDFEPVTCKGMRADKSFKAHTMGISHIVVHPRKPVVATASDDHTWRMWHMPEGDLIMSGEGHKDWVAGLDFHPRGICLASCSGDATVKVWDFARQCCVATFTDHTAAVWSVGFHDQGEILASCSLDHSIRIWDLTTATCKSALRGHVDSVNEIQWLTYTNSVASASSDKTLSVWDARSGLSTATFYGHTNSVNSLSVSLDGHTLASVDADGFLKAWDVRMVAESGTIAVGSSSLNRVRLDRSGTVAAVASDDGHVYSFDLRDQEQLADLQGHEDAVQSIAFDPNGDFFVSAASDCVFKLWT